MSESYWSRVLQSRLSRRRALAATGAGAAGAALLVACGGGDDDGGGGGQATTGGGSKLDPMKGVAGGKFVWESYGDVGGSTEMVKIRNAGVHQLGGLVHDSLLEFDNGKPQYAPDTDHVSPNLATALPEQSPDKLTYTFKIKSGVKFHNGREMTAEDVKYSLDTYATGASSAFKNDYAPWYESSQAPDKTTFVLKTKIPYAETLQGLAGKDDGEILAKEHIEGPDSAKTMIGTGPFTFVRYDAPNSSFFKKNPNYHIQGIPYFDEIERTGNADQEKKIADFISKNVQISYWFPEEDRDRVKAARPDAQIWSYNVPAEAVSMRTDKPPFNDDRVRKALSMAIDRKTLTQALTKGEAESDQVLSWTSNNWGFRRPKDLGANAKWYELNLTEAKALMTASGVATPLKGDMPYWSPLVIGQKYVDQIVLIMTAWKNAGFADFRGVEFTHAQYTGGPLLGNFDPITWHPNIKAIQAKMGISLRNESAFIPGAPKGFPTLNRSYIDDPTMTALVDKQLQQLDKNERKATLKLVEDQFAEKQWHIIGVTHKTTWFGDPTLKNTQPAIEMYNGGTHYMKWWWFDKA